MRAIDTNLLVRLIARDDARQVTAAEGFIEGGAWISHLVLIETVWVLTSLYHFGQAQVVTAVEMLLNHRELVIQDPDTILAALAHYRNKYAPDFSDCLILELARKNGHLPLGTFDRRLGKAQRCPAVINGQADESRACKRGRRHRERLPQLLALFWRSFT